MLVAALFVAYKLARGLTAGDAQVAMVHAYDVWHVERWLRLPDELNLQQAFLHWPHLIKAANSYYAWVHFPATTIFLVWLYRRDHAVYVHVRNVMVVLTGSALALHILVPLAPPRMLGSLRVSSTPAPSTARASTTRVPAPRSATSSPHCPPCTWGGRSWSPTASSPSSTRPGAGWRCSTPR